jgi:hypothetical protein
MFCKKNCLKVFSGGKRKYLHIQTGETGIRCPEPMTGMPEDGQTALQLPTA